MHFRSARRSEHRGRLIARLLVHVAVLTPTTIAADGQPPAQPLRGSWTATAGPNQVFHGTWSARPVEGSPNSASGSWSLVNGSNQIVVSGTWSATKTARLWSGTWRARTVAARGIPGREFSGTWRTEIKTSDARTLGELLQQTMQHEVSGAWQSGGMSGTWSLSALR
jgi:hypothetical protein